MRTGPSWDQHRTQADGVAQVVQRRGGLVQRPLRPTSFSSGSRPGEVEAASRGKSTEGTLEP